MESESLIPFETKGYKQNNNSRRVKKPPWSSTETKQSKESPVSSISTPPQERSLPIPFDLKTSQKVYLSYQMFNIDNPRFSKDYKLTLGEILKSTVEYYCAFNPHRDKVKLAHEVARRSILEKGFNDRYSKVYKYCRQCYFGEHWAEPDDFPIPEGILNIRSWKDLRVFLLRTGKPGTPEILLPPELLYPWESPIPEDIEYLEEPYAGHDINIERIRKIIQSKLVQPKVIPTKTDFMLSQTNTKMAVEASSIHEVEYKHEKKKKLTNYKYSVISQWADSGFPEQDHLAVRTPVWKRTTEYRDAITLNPCTLFKVWNLNAHLKYMINDKGVGDYKDMADVLTFAKSHSFFILTDWKKSGLTIPHWFVKLVLEEINEIISPNKIDFPVNGWPIFDQTKGKWFVPNSFGYGLGMVNNIYTLFNLVLFQYGKEEGIFEEKDEMISFNDDSAIGCSSERSYSLWLSICRKSGGYLDKHKTFTSKGVQFCEMHQFKDVKNNFKWVSAFNTAIMAMLKAYNWDHYRFLISDIWDQTRGFDSDISNETPWQHFLGTSEHYIKLLCSAFWSVQEIPEGPPELGGVAIGYYYRTDYSLKNTLLLVEQMKGWDLIRAQTFLKASKECFSYTPSFRPWVKMTNGPTKSLMQTLGKYGGLHHELESFSLKAKNKFVLDTKWFQEQFWSHYTKICNEALANPIIDHDWWIWCKQQRWPSFAIPNAFVVKEEILPPTQRVLPFCRMEKEKAKYSLPSMMVAYIQYFKDEIVSEIPVEEISFRGYLLWEAPVLQAEHYRPITDMRLISKISEFSDPRRTFLDYWYRNNSVPTELDLPDFKSEAALDLISQIEGTDIRTLGYDRATWYTNIPLPYRSEWEEHLNTNLPDTHEEIIMSLSSGELPNNRETAVFLKEDFDNDRRQNRSFWKSKTKSKERSGKKRKAALGSKAPAQTITEEEPLTLLNMDDILEVMIRINAMRDSSGKINYDTPRELSWKNRLTGLQLEDRGEDFYTEPEEEEYNWEQEEDEDSLIAKALDQFYLNQSGVDDDYG